MTCPPQIAAVAAVMDEIGQCRNPMPCELCQQRMQSVLDMGAAAERELLTEAADALWACAKAALTVKPTLDSPYPDAPEWTPYTRWVERPARHAHDLAMRIRRHLKPAELPTEERP